MKQKSYARSLTIEEKNALNSIVFTNNIAWISVSTQAGKDIFYDVLTRQILTPSVPLDMVFLGPNKGNIISWIIGISYSGIGMGEKQRRK